MVLFRWVHGAMEAAWCSASSIISRVRHAVNCPGFWTPEIRKSSTSDCAALVQHEAAHGDVFTYSSGCQ